MTTTTATSTKPAKLPRATRAGRLTDYLNEMFPPAIAIPVTFATFASVWFALHALSGLRPINVGWRAILAGVTVVLFSLLLRVYDELKDVETDLRLGRAGDPRYKDRAVVTGRVQVGDIVALRNAVLVALVLVNLPLGFPLPFVVFAGVLFLLYLSSRWFFWPAVSRHLLLAFVTHNPLAMAMSVYVIAVFMHDRGVSTIPAGTVPLVLGYWMTTATWEVARKVRHPSQETDYQTYSKILGFRLAGIVPALFGAAAVVCLVVVMRKAGLSYTVPAVLVGGWVLLAAACLRFQIAPSPAAAKLLQPASEVLAGLAGIPVPIALALHQGLAFW